MFKTNMHLKIYKNLLCCKTTYSNLRRRIWVIWRKYHGDVVPMISYKVYYKEEKPPKVIWPLLRFVT